MIRKIMLITDEEQIFEDGEEKEKRYNSLAVGHAALI